jgi:Malate:quinone oxidoreductase (Mqo)
VTMSKRARLFRLSAEAIRCRALHSEATQKKHSIRQSLLLGRLFPWRIDAALVMEGRASDQPVAATRIITGTDVDYGSLTHHLVRHLVSQPSARCITRTASQTSSESYKPPKQIRSSFMLYAIVEFRTARRPPLRSATTSQPFGFMIFQNHIKDSRRSIQ